MANRFYFSASCKANFPLLTDPNGLSSGSASCSSSGGHGQPLKEIHCTRIACTHPPRPRPPASMNSSQTRSLVQSLSLVRPTGLPRNPKDWSELATEPQEVS